MLYKYPVLIRICLLIV